MDLWSPWLREITLELNEDFIPGTIIATLILLAFFASAGYLTFKDAKRRGMNGIAFFLAVFFLGPVGVALYFYFRGDKPIITVTPKYEMIYYKPFEASPIAPGSKVKTRFCIRCGGLVTVEIPSCPKCGNMNLLRR